MVGVSDSVRAGAPSVEQVAEVCAVHDAIAIEITRRVGGRWTPLREQRAKVCAVDVPIDEQVREALAGIGNRVEIEVRSAGGEFARVADTVAVAICLRRVRDGWAVVVGVGAAVAVGVDEWRPHDCDGVESAPRDA